MYPASFEYHAPSSVQEALGLLGKLEDAKILAGGHSLIPMMKLRLAQPKNLIDLRKVGGLNGIKEDGSTIVIGSMATHWDVESSKVLKAKVPVVAECAAVIGDPAVRNKGTIGGSLAYADPVVDMPARMNVEAGPGQAITLHFVVTDSAGSVAISMSPEQARRLAQELCRAAGDRQAGMI